MSTVAIILATDEGEDFEGSKYLADVAGAPLIANVVAASMEWDVLDRVVVLGSDGEKVAEAIADYDVTTLIDPEWGEGAAASMRAALDFVSRNRSVDRCLVVRADQIDLPSSVVSELLDRAEATGADAVVPKYRYARGWPIVIGSSLFPRLLGSEGDLDLHNLVSMHANAIEECWFDQLAPPLITSAEDLPRRRT